MDFTAVQKAVSGQTDAGLEVSRARACAGVTCAALFRFSGKRRQNQVFDRVNLCLPTLTASTSKPQEWGTRTGTKTSGQRLSAVLSPSFPGTEKIA